MLNIYWQLQLLCKSGVFFFQNCRDLKNDGFGWGFWGSRQGPFQLHMAFGVSQRFQLGPCPVFPTDSEDNGRPQCRDSGGERPQGLRRHRQPLESYARGPGAISSAITGGGRCCDESAAFGVLLFLFAWPS